MLLLTHQKRHCLAVFSLWQPWEMHGYWLSWPATPNSTALHVHICTPLLIHIFADSLRCWEFGALCDFVSFLPSLFFNKHQTIQGNMLGLRKKPLLVKCVTSYMILQMASVNEALTVPDMCCCGLCFMFAVLSLLYFLFSECASDFVAAVYMSRSSSHVLFSRISNMATGVCHFQD